MRFFLFVFSFFISVFFISCNNPTSPVSESQQSQMQTTGFSIQLEEQLPTIHDSFEMYSNNTFPTLKISITPSKQGIVELVWYICNARNNNTIEIFRESYETQKDTSYCYEKTPLNSPFLETIFYCVVEYYTGNDVFTYETSKISFIQTIPQTNTPQVFINTDNYEDIISKEDYLNSTFNISSDTFDNLSLSNVQIKGRGNSSWAMPKKSFSLKFQSKEKVLGMKKNKRWVLIANYADRTLLRNQYASYLGNSIFTNMDWNPSFEQVELIINGEYLGTYLIGESIKIDEKRVDIPDISDDLENGGFICEINTLRMDELFNFYTTHGVGFSLKDPDEVSIETQEKIQTIIQNAEDSLFIDDFTNPELGYRAFFDVDSLVDWYLLNEFLKTPDAAFYTSVYIYYDSQDCKIHFGPNWDYDTSCANSKSEQYRTYNDFYIRDGTYSKYWFQRLFEDDTFLTTLKTRWNEIKIPLSDSINNYIQEKADNLGQAISLNFKRWKVFGTQPWFETPGWENRNTYQSEIDYMVEWLLNRYSWFDEQLNGF